MKTVRVVILDGYGSLLKLIIRLKIVVMSTVVRCFQGAEDANMGRR